MFHQCYKWVCDGWAYMDTRDKTPEIFKDLIRVCTIPINFQVMYPCHMYLQSITGTSKIVPRPTNKRQSIEGLQ
jgi:hypothetical protein